MRWKRCNGMPGGALDARELLAGTRTLRIACPAGQSGFKAHAIQHELIVREHECFVVHGPVETSGSRKPPDNPSATQFFIQCCSRHPTLNRRGRILAHSSLPEKARSPGRDCGPFVQNFARRLK